MSDRQRFEAVLGTVCDQRSWILTGQQIEVKLESGRRQIVLLDFFEFEETELVRLYTVIGAADRIEPPRLALRLNFDLPHGALAVKGDDLVMTDTLVVADADPGEVGPAIAFLAKTGDRFEETLFGPDEH